MKKSLLLAFALALFASNWREEAITSIDKIITTYQHRLKCLETQEAATCIDRFPQDPHSDALAKTFAMSFPKAFYANKLSRDIEILQRQKLCFGKALTQEAAKECATDLR